MTPTLHLAAEAGAHGTFSWGALLFGLFLLVANGFFVAAEIALLAARRARIEERAEEGDPRAKIALRALQELSITFSGAQLGITMASLGLGAVAEPAVAALFEGWLAGTPLSPGARGGIAFALALSIVVFLHMVVGEMAPKNLALAEAEEVSLRLARPFRAFVFVFRPLILVLNSSANVLVRLVGVDPVDEVNLVHTPDELALALRESRRHGTVEPQDVRVMTAALRLSDIDAEAAMTPRVDLVALADDAPLADVLERAGTTGFTRFPVFHRDIDDIVGLVHVKDVLIADDALVAGGTVADLLRPIPAVPESRDLEHLLRDMRADRSHAVLVVDEFGGTAGVLSLEDVIEELVGEIEDEFDLTGPDAESSDDRVWVVAGTLRHDELERLTSLRLPASEAETVSGWMTEQLGRLLRRGDTLRTDDGWQLRVLTLEGRRAGDVEVLAPDTPDARGSGAGT
ncbi:MAG: hemolysin family protein [Actinobacteria bacterium]|nr:hemolysin family protein [Actinomycetota bacterium]